MGRVIRCCICGTLIYDSGNDPWPLEYPEDARCCNNCNLGEVIPARLQRIELANKEEFHNEQS